MLLVLINVFNVNQDIKLVYVTYLAFNDIKKWDTILQKTFNIYLLTPTTDVLTRWRRKHSFSKLNATCTTGGANAARSYRHTRPRFSRNATTLYRHYG